jgi:Carboxypeptidase regulatory-like domain/TonB dependent receptor-like, beta-barrel
MTVVRRVLLIALVLLVSATAHAQVQTGSIAGTVTDASNLVLPGVTVSLTGDKLIGGQQAQTTDASGAYRFDRLPPGSYHVKFELQGFRSVDRAEIAINAAFVATVNAKLEVGNVTETITVTGESPTVDTKSNVQQTIMNQEILEGVPTGRDPWSLAKLIPGVQVATYDVGGTQSMQQSSMSAHGSSTNDVSYNIDGATVNWPGGGGGATMLYYDQGMFEEVNYITSAIPAEIMAGGVSINMVTKDGGNKWRGRAMYNISNDNLQSINHGDAAAEAVRINPTTTFLGNPTQKTYDLNVSGGGKLIENRMWVNGTIRKWVVNKLVNAKNPDGTQALDDNDLKNYSGKVVTALTPNNKFGVSYLWNNKIRGHRRDTPPNLVPDIAALKQTNPASTTQAKYTGLRNKLVFESNFSAMIGQTNYLYQDNTPANAIRVVDNTLSTAANAAGREEHQPNSRYQYDNVVSYSANALGGDHLLKGGVQWGRLYYESQQTVLGDYWIEYSNNVPQQIREWNTPANPKNVAVVSGFFFQDAWTIASRLTLNIGGRWDKYVGTLPDQSNPGGTFIAARTQAEQEVMNQSKGVWRLGASYDVNGTGKTAVKASYSRYALQVGIDRVTNVNPLSAGSRTCPWSDPNKDGQFQLSEVTVSQCSAFSGGVSTFYDTNGVAWPYSDEVTTGVETQLPGGVRLGAMFYYRTNRDQFGQRNTAVPTNSYTPFQFLVPNGPGGTTSAPKPITVTAYNLAPSLTSAQNNIRDNDPFLDTQYKGVEFTANKRFSKKWQMVAGLTIGKNDGGVTNGTDLNDPNVTMRPQGIVGNDSKVAFRASGSYELPGAINLAASLVSNGGYPYQSNFSITRALAAAQGVTLTRASQTVVLSDRGDERYETVTSLDLRLARPFRFNGRKFQPSLDIFNLSNSNVIVSRTVAVGSSYLSPAEILAPRIIRVAFSFDF